MDKPLSLRRNFSWTFAGNMVNAASMWAIVAGATKLGDTAMVGKLELGRTIAAPIIAITLMQLRAVQVTDARSEYSFADYLGTRLTMLVLSISAFIVIAFGWYSGETAWVILLWGLAKCIDSVSDIVRGLFQKYERMNLSGTSLMIKGPSFLVVAMVLLLLTGELTVAIVGGVFVCLLVLFLYDYPQAHRLLAYQSATERIAYRILPRFNVKIILAMLRLSLPLGMVMFLGALQSSIPRLVLESHHGEVALGYFGPIAYPMLLSMLAVSAMGQSAAPRLANYYINDMASYCRLLKKLLLLALGMGLVFIACVVVFGKFALRVLYTADYANYHTEFIILAVGGAAAFMSCFCGYGLTSARVFRRQLFLGLTACLAAAILTFLLVPAYGLRGAAITSSATYFVMLACSFNLLLGVIRKRQKEIKDERYE